MPFRPYLTKQFSICFDLYLSICQEVDSRVQVALGQEGANWRLQHACLACTHKLQDEPELEFSLLFCMDGNNSVKRIPRQAPGIQKPEDDDITVGVSNKRPDLRKVEGDYYLSRKIVGCWGKESIDKLLLEPGFELANSDDPSIFCEDRWKNMAEELTARMWGIFDETGIFLNIGNVGVFDEWLAEERLYLLNLQREPLQETLVMEYWQQLVNLGASDRDVAATEQAWRILTPTTSPDHIDNTRMAETKRRHAQEQAQKDLLAVQGLEMKHCKEMDHGRSGVEEGTAGTNVASTSWKV
ncbi:hypothetical protein K443DRAFT_15807 [Laccaria amethystina LaAM-08-1]|uniref:Unplaced genomic scaffold K443scaffold_912, whole genome shotgun sequence n=1 Tax=Laccaria amethystina LaAM-08-1 TaxID=1095629 RepID=A0A0C9WGN7_9AGAR|nr:hypothetical protein K443DRAFT_15807 [Laccaria amethystina LaAM-08-1]